VNRFAKGELDVDAAIRLAGLIAFVDGVEKGFIEKLKQRYGDDLISRLCSSAIQRKGFGRINPLPDDDL
tara:strand:- start:78092 stop:78298 length:207 start_codon:yes stop_codon:yes gene_type:complete